MQLDSAWKVAASASARLSARVVSSQGEHLALSNQVLRPLSFWQDRGVMLTAYVAGGSGYCATADLSALGLSRAATTAIERASLHARSGLMAGLNWPMPPLNGGLENAFDKPFQQVTDDRSLKVQAKALQNKPLPSRQTLILALEEESSLAHANKQVVASEFSLAMSRSESTLWLDGRLLNSFETQFVSPHAQVTVAENGEAQTRSLAGRYNGYCQQGGLEVLERSGFVGCGARLVNEALALARAPVCPDLKTDLLLMPDQMMLQIHESIGHPLELDRILGDERNFAGTSFVDMEMFGHYQYGSPLLNVSFDPLSYPEELATYSMDDDGFTARKSYLIEAGILKRPLGSALSQARAQSQGVVLEAVANARAIGWHRPAIDRMANINVEPGSTKLSEMIASVELGVMMRTNVSWSIDDSRNKFQFGCEWGQMIRGGQLAEVVKNPNYRGISANFWRSLKAVGDSDSHEVMGTPFCGKGEPGQVIRVGHASPACLFTGVDVFGGRG